jgi:hypothetical protein
MQGHQAAKQPARKRKQAEGGDEEGVPVVSMSTQEQRVSKDIRVRDISRTSAALGEAV